jgi:hypothetical protein
LCGEAWEIANGEEDLPARASAGCLFSGAPVFVQARSTDNFSLRYNFVKEIGESFRGLRRKLYAPHKPNLII